MKSPIIRAFGVKEPMRAATRCSREIGGIPGSGEINISNLTRGINP
jgi:hypothetical protein